MCAFVPHTRRVQRYATKIRRKTFIRHHQQICSRVDLHDGHISHICNKGCTNRRGYPNAWCWVGIAGRRLVVTAKATSQARASKCAHRTNSSRIEQRAWTHIWKRRWCNSQTQGNVRGNVLHLHSSRHVTSDNHQVLFGGQKKQNLSAKHFDLILLDDFVSMINLLQTISKTKPEQISVEVQNLHFNKWQPTNTAYLSKWINFSISTSTYSHLTYQPESTSQLNFARVP